MKLCVHATNPGDTGVTCTKGLHGGSPSHAICADHCPAFQDSGKPHLTRKEKVQERPLPPPLKQSDPPPTEWGPVIWRKLFLAQNADQIFLDATLAEIKSHNTCTCSADAIAYVAANPPVFGAGWFEWVWRWKNAVNRKLGKPEISLDSARAVWFPVIPPVPRRAILVGRWFNLVMRKNAVESMQVAASRWGVEYIELTKSLAGRDPHGGGRAFNEKINLDQHASGYDQVVYLDADVIIRSDCPSPFDLVPLASFGAVPSQMPGHDFTGDAITHLAPVFARLGMQFDATEDHFNGGLYLFSPAYHGCIFAQARRIAVRERDRHWTCFEEGYVSASVKLLGCSVTSLPHTFNRCGGPSREWWKPEMESYIQHYCGGGIRDQRMDETIWRI